MRSQDRLHGDIDLAPPTSWQTISIGVAVTFTMAAVFLSTAHYARITQAGGVVESTLGTIDVSSGVSGTVTRLGVVEGQHVIAGQRLAIVDHSTNAGGNTLEARRAAAATAEQAAIEGRTPAIRAASAARVAAFGDEAASARADLSSAQEQMGEQQTLIDAARQDLAKAQTIAERGFVSQQDLRRREETLATRQQGMSRLRQQAAAARATIARTSRDVEQERANLTASIGQIDNDRAQAQSRGAAIEATPRTIITAPATGVIAGLVITPGVHVEADTTTMTVIPNGGRNRVKLLIPPAAAAAVAPGQTARLAVDAFPFQTYGTIRASIDRITPAAIATKDGPRFIAYATPAAPGVSSYGVVKPLRPGMTVTARIKTMDRNLMQWLLDPLYAVTSR